MKTKDYVGVSLSNVFLIVFITLKLTGLIDWSWVWVLSPFWIPFSILVVCVFIYYILDEFK